MIQTLGASNRLCEFADNGTRTLMQSVSPHWAAADSPHLSNAMINKYLIKFGVSNGEFTKHTRPPPPPTLFHPLCLRA